MKKNLSMDFFSSHVISLLIATILGAKALYWLFNYDVLFTYISTSIEHQDFLAIFKYIFNIEQFYVLGGLLSFGGLFYFYLKKNNQPPLPWLDAIVPAFYTSFIFGFIGSFLGGYYVGKPSPSFPGMIFTGDPNYSFAAANYIVPIHPIQLYSMILAIIVVFILREVGKKIHAEGAVGSLGIFLLSIQVIIIEFLRGSDNIPNILGVSLNQYIGLGGVLFALYLFTKKVPRITA